jgi:autotransporter-associated beta strand protein
LAGTLNSGGGGGGASHNTTGTGGAGGSGIVVIRYLGAQAATGGDSVVSGTGSASGYTVHQFTSVGTSSLEFFNVGASLTGNISGSNNLTIDAGSGTVTLTGASTYSGSTTVSQGVLKIGGETTGSVGSVTASPLGRGDVVVNSGVL